MAVGLGPVMWADPDAVAGAHNVDTEMATSAVREASWVLWALTGRRLHAAGTRAEQYRVANAPFRAANQLKIMGPDPAVIEIELLDPRPGGEDVTLEADEWYIIGQRVELLRCSGPIISITYTVGSNLPPGTILATETLAGEWVAARLGKECRLPDRITQVTRSGTSWTVFDPTDIIANGKSGIPEIDTWLAVVNPKAQKQLARVVDPGKPRLIKAEWVGVTTGDDVDDIAATVTP